MRIIIPKYKLWLATAALATILTVFLANGPLAADPEISARIAAIATVAGDMGSKRTEPPTSPWEIIDPTATGLEKISP
jgi:hypothetical protein